MGADYYKIMLNEIGPVEMAKLEADRQKVVKAYDHYLKLIEEYEKIIQEENNSIGSGSEGWPVHQKEAWEELL